MKRKIIKRSSTVLILAMIFTFVLGGPLCMSAVTFANDNTTISLRSLPPHGTQVSYTSAGSKPVRFTVTYDGDTYKGACATQGIPEKESGKATVEAIDPNSKIGKMIYYYGYVCQFWSGANKDTDAYQWLGISETAGNGWKARMIIEALLQRHNMGWDAYWDSRISGGYRMMSDDWANAINAAYNNFDPNAVTIEGTFEIFHGVTDAGHQDFYVWKYTTTGYAALRKSADRQPQNNMGATLAGAVYNVYLDEGCTVQATDINGNPIALTTDANGNTAVVALNTGIYYAKEVTPSTGFNLDPNVLGVEVTAYNTADSPAMFVSVDPLKTGFVSVKKQSGNTDITG